MQFSSFGEVPVVINDEERDVFLRELTEIGGGGGGGGFLVTVQHTHSHTDVRYFQFT